MRAVWYETVGPADEVLKIGERATTRTPARARFGSVSRHQGLIHPMLKRDQALAARALPSVIPHSDGAGLIDEVGAGVNSARLGERVWVWNAAWRRPNGTCAQFICLPSTQAPLLPKSVSFEAGACLGIPASTACHAVFADGTVSGQTILVTGGAGAVGHSAIQLAKWGGAQVVATVSGEKKAEAAHAAGADAVVNYRHGDTAAEILRAAGGKVDRIVEVEFGGNLAISNSILKTGGVIATYGSMAAPEPTLPFYPMMFNHTTVRMMLVYLLSERERAAVIDRLDQALCESALAPLIAKTFDLEQTREAHRAVEAATSIGNIVVRME